ncbi:hypothetical protein B0H16DRAFT_483860 [Mycena metata]|uniref:F-box domain-containing protein n=1 Tax=Mycena metata TaxID=1033252 RepID=A0AAD7P115_9AGAR|nr:hypothetical protein B0H16DRAFT_483860 [Mycena metata]
MSDPPPLDLILATNDPNKAASFFSETLPLCESWRDVELRLPFDSYSPLFAHTGHFPLLRTLTLSTESNVWRTGQTITIRNAPLLRKVTFPAFSILAVDIPWEQLTRLTIQAHVANPAVPTLRRCVNLVRLDFTLTVFGPELADAGPFTLPCLKTLRTAGTSILSFITTPILERLSLRIHHWDDIDLTESLQALLQRSACSIQKLSFHSFHPAAMSSVEFTTFLGIVPSVDEIELALSDGSDNLFAVLEEEDVLPRLATLRIVDASGQATFEAAFDVLDKRRETVAGRAVLESFVLTLAQMACSSTSSRPTCSLRPLDQVFPSQCSSLTALPVGPGDFRRLGLGTCHWHINIRRHKTTKYPRIMIYK